MTLYIVENGIGTYWVLANHPTEASEKVEKVLNEADYGFFSKRKTTQIKVVATEVKGRDLTNNFLIP